MPVRSCRYEVTQGTWTEIRGTYAMDSLVEYGRESTHVCDRENRVEELALPAVVVAFEWVSVASGDAQHFETYQGSKASPDPCLPCDSYEAVELELNDHTE